MWEGYTDEAMNSWIDHFLPEWIIFSQSALGHFLPECFAPGTTHGCHTVELFSMQYVKVENLGN